MIMTLILAFINVAAYLFKWFHDFSSPVMRDWLILLDHYLVYENLYGFSDNGQDTLYLKIGILFFDFLNTCVDLMGPDVVWTVELLQILSRM